MPNQKRKVRLNSFTRVTFAGIEGGTLEIQYNNFGEPYREGLQISIADETRSISATIEYEDLEGFAEVINRACDVDFNVKGNDPAWRLWSPDPSMGSAKRWVVTYGGMVIGTISKQVDRSSNLRREYYRIENILDKTLPSNDFEAPDSAACALVDNWENRNTYEDAGINGLRNMVDFPDREIAIGRITAMRICDYRLERNEYGSNDWLIEQIQCFDPLRSVSDEQLNLLYRTEVSPTAEYPWEQPDLRVSQREFLGILNGINPEDPWIELFKSIWE